MKTTDRLFAWALLILGCMHSAGTFIAYKTLGLEAIWFLTGGLTMIFCALLNLIRAARPADKLTLGASTLANLLLFAVFVIAVPWLLHHEFKQNPQVIVVGITVTVEFVFSLKQWFR
jgi:hypothetical protein